MPQPHPVPEMVTILIFQSLASSCEPMASRHAKHPVLTASHCETAIHFVDKSIELNVSAL